MGIRENRKGKEISQLYEFVFVPVPKEQKRRKSSLFLINMGYVTAFSCYLIGAKIGYAMPLWKAIAACVVGSIFLTFIAVFMGIAASRTGLSTSFLAREILGRQGSMVLSFFLILFSISWISMNGDAFARSIIVVFSQFPLPIPVTAMLVITLWSFSASRGMKGIGIISYVTVPIIVVITIAEIVSLGTKTNGFDFIRSYQPAAEMSFAVGVSMIIGNFIFGCTVSPDIFRFAESDKVVCFGSFSYLLGFLPPNICGVLIAQAAKTDDFSLGVSRLGFVIPFFICTVLCLWTTEDNNVYSASLAMQNLFYKTPIEGNLSHKTIAYIISGLAAAFASLGVVQYLMPTIACLSFLVPPLAGLILCEYFILKEGEKSKVSALIAWIVSAIAGCIALLNNFLIPSLVSFITAAAVYYILRKLRRLNSC